MACIEITEPGATKPVRTEITDGVIIGRSHECDVVVEDESVSAKHAWIRRIGNDHIIVDLRSTNGVKVNGEPVTELKLHDGDRFDLCDTRGVFLDSEERSRRAREESDPFMQCAVCGYLVPGHLERCPRCKGELKDHSAWTPVDREAYGAARTRRFVRAMAALSFAGGVVGPLLLGVGWMLGIVLGVMILSGYAEETDERDRRMARRGVLLGLLWLAVMAWAVYAWYFILG